MKNYRHWIPAFGIFALIILFFKLPETPNVFGLFGCKNCSAETPYLTLIGAGYFATLLAISWLFPSFPNTEIAKGGFLSSILLAVSLTYIKLPSWCTACLLDHACNISIWTIWMFAPSTTNVAFTSSFRERFCLTVLIPISIVALFSCLNLTFMAYGFKSHASVTATGLQAGHQIPAFTAQIANGDLITHQDFSRISGVVINFVTPNCPYCQEQLPILNSVATQLKDHSYRFINITPLLPSDLAMSSSATEWIEDKAGKLREAFKVLGYPTLFIVAANGKILEIIPGVPKQLEAHLKKTLALDSFTQ